MGQYICNKCNTPFFGDTCPACPARSGLDKFLDMADGAADAIVSALGPGEEGGQSPGPDGDQPRKSRTGKPIIDVEPNQRNSNQPGQKVLGDVWKNDLKWAATLKGDQHVWHNFPSDSLDAVCNEKFKSHEITGRVVLEHGKRIVACTSCIIGVTRRG